MTRNYSASTVARSDKFATGTVNHCLSMVRRLRQHAAKMRILQKQHEQMAWQAGQ